MESQENSFPWKSILLWGVLFGLGLGTGIAFDTQSTTSHTPLCPVTEEPYKAQTAYV